MTDLLKMLADKSHECGEKAAEIVILMARIAELEREVRELEQKVHDPVEYAGWTNEYWPD